MTLTIAVLGARGRLGRCVAKAGIEAGHRILAVTRDGKLPAGLEKAEARAADALDRQQLIEATRGADVIFNGLNPVYTDWEKVWAPMAANVAAAAKAHGALHLFAGNVYNFGREIPARVTPGTAQHGSTRKGAVRISIEAGFEKAAREDGVDTTILHAGDFYGGTGTGSWFDLVIGAKIRKGVFTWPGRADIPHAFAYLPDLGRAFIALAEKRDVLKGFNRFTFSGHTMSGETMMNHAAAAAGRPLKRSAFPWLLIRAGGLVVPMWRELAEMAYLWFTPHQLDGSRLESVTGPLAATPEAEAVRQALIDMESAASNGKAA